MFVLVCSLLFVGFVGSAVVVGVLCQVLFVLAVGVCLFCWPWVFVMVDSSVAGSLLLVVGSRFRNKPSARSDSAKRLVGQGVWVRHFSFGCCFMFALPLHWKLRAIVSYWLVDPFGSD